MPDAVPEPVLYSQAGCGESARVRAWLVEHGIAFRERDVSADPEAARALAAMGLFATPLVVAGAMRILGYRPEALAAALLRGET